MNHFHGRDLHFIDFQQLLQNKKAKLATCQGRRRIGKSTFITQCADETTHFINISGLAPRPDLDRAAQLENFSQELSRQLNTPKIPLPDWPTAFHYLASILPKTGSTLLQLDEISWMAIGDPDFPGHLKNTWDQHFSEHSGLILVLCGSVSSWIEKNILNHTGFVGRISWQFHLEPLPLQHCNAFWKEHETRSKREIPPFEKLRLLSVTGGVPRYLEAINFRQSTEANITRLCFRSGGLLFNEFEQIFHDIFTKKAPTYRAIVRTLVNGPRTLREISEALNRESGGSLTEALSNLAGSGFITAEHSISPTTAKPLARTIRYRLTDNYLRFYLKYVEPHREQITKGIYTLSPLESLEAWDTIIGLQFENLIYNSRHELLDLLGISQNTLNYGPFFQNQTKRKKACQVDLLIRTQSALYIVETKARKIISAEVIDEVAEKVNRLKAPKNLAIRTALVYQGELTPTLAQSDYFDHTISFHQLLNYKTPRPKRRRKSR